MNILIIGITGFVGSNLTAELYKRHKLLGLDLRKVDENVLKDKLSQLASMLANKKNIDKYSCTNHSSND